MKLTAIVISIFLLPACLSKTSKTLTFSGKQVSLKELFNIIKGQTGVVFFYDSALLGTAKPVTIHWEKISLQAALNDVFHGQEVTWVLEDKTVTLIKKPSVIIEPTTSTDNDGAFHHP